VSKADGHSWKFHEDSNENLPETCGWDLHHNRATIPFLSTNSSQMQFRRETQVVNLVKEISESKFL
jgi:hypothetical protein